MYLVLEYKSRTLKNIYLLLRFLLVIIQKEKDNFIKIGKYPKNENLPLISLNFFVYGLVELELRSLRFS